VKLGEVVLGGLGDVARTAIGHQKITHGEMVGAPAEMPQSCNVVLGVVGFQAKRLHLSARTIRKFKMLTVPCRM